MDGFVLLKDIFSAEEMDKCCESYDRMFSRARACGDNVQAKWKGDWQTDVDEQGKPTSVLSIHNVQLHDASKILLMLLLLLLLVLCLTLLSPRSLQPSPRCLSTSG